ncbi:exodeoxyribonuclease V subunit gamma [Neisseria sp. Ec49-e6-T10]|uniref:exodeoxyribonuclease V subunit gamma n=1 Tax=Neisseria sp. Ec49-e6-T10 TaxID=3140744 RepID=UPI003EBB04CB
MLYLYHSNQLEQLAQIFSAMTEQIPLENGFAQEVVWVQSHGMGRFLNLYLAKTQGICANMSFVLPASFTWQLMKRALGTLPEENIYSIDVMSWRIFALLNKEQIKHATALQHYVQLGQSAQFELAHKIAQLFDQYLVYRPNWIESWEKGQLCSLGEDESWQQALWQQLTKQEDTPHRVALWKALLEQLPQTQLPERITVFGVAALAPMYLDLLNHLAKYTNVFIFTLNPCQEYWGDLIEAAQIIKQPEAFQQLNLSGHPLLASLGKQGRDFFDALNDIPNTEKQFFVKNPEATLLAQLQNDLLTLHLSGFSLSTQDKSIQIHSTHSTVRELQVLKDQILSFLEEDPTLLPNDIAVLTPNIDAYTPFIQSIFSGQTDTPQTISIPFSITDTELGSMHPLLSSFNHLLDILDSRFEVERILNLLDIHPIAKKFNLSEQDIQIIHFHIEQMNIHWAIDSQMREKFGDNSTAFTWEQGLLRLSLGLLLPNDVQQFQAPALWAQTAPSQLSFEHAQILGQFISLVHALAEQYKLWQTPCDAHTWVERLHHVFELFFELEPADTIAANHLEQIFFSLEQNTSLAKYQQEFSLEVIKQYIQRHLSVKNDHNFLKGGVTFGSMVPMRSLPFKILCLIGLNDTDYPRDEKAISFDLINKHPIAADRSRRNDDRYLFLEAILSARQKLYISYIGKNIKTDETLPPSTLVNELLDTITSMTGLNQETLSNCLITQHPLHAFSHHYFTKENDQLFSYQGQLAEALNQQGKESSVFFDQTRPLQNNSNQSALSWPQFTQFWRNPTRYWLKNTLGTAPLYLEETQESDEPFIMTAQQLGVIRHSLLQAKLQQQPLYQANQLLMAQNQLPIGQLGQLYTQCETTLINHIQVPEILAQPALTPFNFKLVLDKLILSGTIDQLYPQGQIWINSGVINTPSHIHFILNHILLCAVQPIGVKQKQSIFFSTENQITYPELSQQQATELLNKWVAFFMIGQQFPLPFFARTSLKTAQAYLKALNKKATIDKAQQTAMKEASNIYFGNHLSKGQGKEAENLLVFSGIDPLNDDLFWTMIEQLLLPILSLKQQDES